MKSLIITSIWLNEDDYDTDNDNVDEYLTFLLPHKKFLFYALIVLLRTKQITRFSNLYTPSKLVHSEKMASIFFLLG